jgi:hypothetical protein
LKSRALASTPLASTVWSQPAAGAMARVAFPPMQIRICLGVACCLLLVLAGCGGGQPAYAKRGDRVCSTFHALAKKVPALPRNATDAQQAAYLSRTVIDARHELAELQALGPPAGDARTYLNRESAQIQDLARGERQLAAGDTAAGERDLRSAAQLSSAIAALAKRYGFKVCGSQFSYD